MTLGLNATQKTRLDWLLKTCLNFKVSKIHSTRRAQISKSPKSLFSCAIQNMDPSNLCCIKLTITLFPQDCNILIYSFLLTGTFKNASCCTCCVYTLNQQKLHKVKELLLDLSLTALLQTILIKWVNTGHSRKPKSSSYKQEF